MRRIIGEAREDPEVAADPKDGDGWTELYRAATNGHEAVVKLLLDISVTGLTGLAIVYQ
ncbi:hypothetical protein QBC45DRAFT_423422 [Copromyces sp. CBS 386.78]|nr:hypothetical protein QBC45DRAFT_423422 [Copromyces sp. CBS 386.78]